MANCVIMMKVYAVFVSSPSPAVVNKRILHHKPQAVSDWSYQHP